MSKLLQQKQSVNTDFPNIRPSLDLRFALAKKLDPRVTFSRGSTGTYFGPDGLMRTAGVNEPRFDHDPVTGQSLGLLVEESRQNLYQRSEEFDNVYWSKFTSSIQSNVITAPDGNVTADKIVINGGVSGGYVIRSTSFTSGTTYTISCFVKAAEVSNFAFVFQMAAFSTNRTARFNLLTGTLGVVDAGVTASIQAFPNGWYRCIATATATATVSDGIQIRPSIRGDGTSGIYIWGAQLEVESFPTSYIPTGASTVTRSADVASMTGTNFSSWYNPSEGSIISSYICRSTNANSADFAVLNSSNTSRIVGWSNINTLPLFIVYANNNAVYLPFVGLSTNQRNIPIKKAISLADKNMRVSTNGKIITGDGGNTGVQDYLPTDFNRMLIGYEGIFANYLNGTISRLTYYPIALTPTQLINLTS